MMAIDCGMKMNIVRSLNARNCDVTIVPWNTPSETIEALKPDGVFISNGPGDPTDAQAVIDTVRGLRGKDPMFDQDNTVMVIEPAYPEYVDTNILGGRKIVHLASGEANSFLPEPDENIQADILYICFPNNPTGAVFNRLQLQAWIDFANENGAVILFASLDMQTLGKIRRSIPVFRDRRPDLYHI